MNFSQKDEDRFWSKVDIKGEDECWDWTAGLFGSGYGSFKLNGTSKGAHCCSLFLEKGDPPIDKPWTLHLCAENRKCCNPNHLYYGTAKQNNGEDKERDGTQANGETSVNSKLTDQQVREIRQKYIPWKYSAKKLSKEYKISKTLIYGIINNKRWKHI